MASEEYRENHGDYEDENALSQEETDAIDAAVSDVAYEVWQENGRDEDLEKLVERMNLEFAEQHRDRPRDEMPGWAVMVADKLENRRSS